MESFLSEYHLPFQDVQDLLRNTNALIAGSAALALYLRQEGIDPGFEPADIDIWAEDTNDLVATQGSYVQRGNFYRFSNFLIKHNYNIVCNAQPEHVEYQDIHCITHILSFVHPTGKKIQVILLRTYDLKTYIVNNFDLSACMSWWNAKDNRFETRYPQQTNQKEMYYSSTIINPRETERINKYVQRGFKLLESPCPYMTAIDSHELVEALQGQPAFDVIAYDEMDAAKFLMASSWNVLVCIGKQFQAFNRKTLYEYLTAHKYSHFELHEIYDTPYKQSISHDARAWISWSDYSIIELRPAYTVQVRNDVKSVFDCNFYTTRQWITNSPPGVTCAAPPKAELEHPPRWALSDANIRRNPNPEWQEPDYYPESWVNS
jgi:hypothetical protein